MQQCEFSVPWFIMSSLARVDIQEIDVKIKGTVANCFEIPKRWHCTTGFLSYYRTSRLNTHSVRKVNAFCKQASNVLSGTRNFKTFDRHMSIMFDQPSQSRAPFAGERRFSKSRGLSASVSFAPLLLPIFALAPFFAWAKRRKPSSSLFAPWKCLLRRLSFHEQQLTLFL